MSHDNEEFAPTPNGGVRKLALIILDGLGHDTARAHMGFLNHLAEQGAASFGSIRSELPSLSRPLYETILTGRTVLEHGVTSNLITRRSNGQSLFDAVRAQGGRTAAAAYSWVRELCVDGPFNPLIHRDLLNPEASIQAGRFYWEDDYPDSHLFADAEALRQIHTPDFLLVHSMNIDDAGHKHGLGSAQYAGSAARADAILAMVLPLWYSQGWQIVVTADHGMNGLGFHGGTSDEERRVPLFCWSPFIKGGYRSREMPQLGMASWLCSLMNVPPPAGMAPSFNW